MKFAVFFKLRPETIAAMMERPSDRRAVVSRLSEAMGGKLESYYFMFGAHDGFVVVDVPSSAAAAAVSLAVGSSGAFSHLETHELIAPEDMGGVLQQAARARGAYTPPGA